MHRTLRHWRALLSVYIQDGLAYRASGVIWVLTDITMAATMPLVLAAAARGGTIAGFTAETFPVYYLVMLLVTSFVTSHFMWEVAFEVREGIFSSQIVRPVGYLQFMAARNLAWRLVRTVIFLPFFGLLLWAYSGMMDAPSLSLTWYALLSVLLGHLVSFLFVMAFAMLALFIQEVNSVFELYYFPMLFLSGQLFPIAMFPDWVRQLALWTPFFYTTGLPTELILGRLTEAQALPLLAGQLAWIVGSYVAFRLLFRFGTRQYTGVGM